MQCKSDIFGLFLCDTFHRVQVFCLWPNCNLQHRGDEGCKINVINQLPRLYRNLRDAIWIPGSLISLSKAPFLKYIAIFPSWTLWTELTRQAMLMKTATTKRIPEKRMKVTLYCDFSSVPPISVEISSCSVPVFPPCGLLCGDRWFAWVWIDFFKVRHFKIGGLSIIFLL